MTWMSAWAVFAASAAIIVYAGAKLSVYGDRIADLTGLGGLWIGMVLMAGATSLPEVSTTVSAGLLDLPDLAVGDLFGAGMTNMLTLGLIDLVHRRKRIWQHTALDHALSAGLAMLLTGLAAFMIVLGRDVEHGGVGLGPLLLLLCYVLGMRVIFRQESMKRRQRELERMAEEQREAQPLSVGRRAELRHVGVKFGLAALCLLLAAPLLARAAGDIAQQSGVSTTFIGASLVAIATSLPELITSLAAVRLGAFDLAVGNLFGSNAFNMAALFFVDLAYRGGAILTVADGAHVLTALWSLVLMNIGLMGIMYRVERRYVLIEPDSFAIIAGYCIGLWWLFQ